MPAVFCLRLALGLLASLWLFSPRELHPRFYRTHFLTALGLVVAAALWAWPNADATQRWVLAASTGLVLFGSLTWALDPAPLGRVVHAASVAAVFAALCLSPPAVGESSMQSRVIGICDDVTSATLLGAAVTAMLVGHSYLISPGLSIRPLIKSVIVLFIALGLRATVAALEWWFWSGGQPTAILTGEIGLWLPVRWLAGLVAPAVFAWMALASARIRSTQSATGILFVVVICSLIGELVGMLLAAQTGWGM